MRWNIQEERKVSLVEVKHAAGYDGRVQVTW